MRKNDLLVEKISHQLFSEMLTYMFLIDVKEDTLMTKVQN